MRIILEGASGAGKTTLARAIHDVTAAPIYRPFRGKTEHIDQKMVMDMQDLGLSVNGWQEDLYTADFLSVVLSTSVIIDRSMPSALAWDEVSSSPLLPSQRRAVVRLWAERIVAARAVLVLVACDAQTRMSRIEAARLDGVGYDWEVEGIRKAIREISHEAQTLPVWCVRTDRGTPTDIATALARRVLYGTQSHYIETIRGTESSPVFLDG